MTISGIDVANYQSATPDLLGASFCIVKATEGTGTVNALQVGQAAHARAAGLHVGFYHFLWPGNIQQQAEYFVTQCASIPGDSLWIDWETTEAGTSASCAEKDEMLAAVKALRPDHKVGLYCDKDFWLNIDTTSDCGDGLWIATAGVPVGEPGIEHSWVLHQYAVTGNVDQDVAQFADLEAMKAWAAPPTPKPPAPPAPSYEPFPGADWFHIGRVSAIVGRMHDRLVAEGCDRYHSSLAKDLIGTGDVASYEAWQAKYSAEHHLGWSGDALKWPPGKESWDGLQVPKG
jgi:hypothetical protein